MPTYISLINWTEQGVKAFKDTTKRADAAKAAAKRIGGRLNDIYWTIGAYDLVAITEFPDDETATAFMLALSSEGNVRTETLRGYNATEIAAIIAKAS
jgi:uncharacterized protein with GYD domain